MSWHNNKHYRHLDKRTKQPFGSPEENAGVYAVHNRLRGRGRGHNTSADYSSRRQLSSRYAGPEHHTISLNPDYRTPYPKETFEVYCENLPVDNPITGTPKKPQNWRYNHFNPRTHNYAPLRQEPEPEERGPVDGPAVLDFSGDNLMTRTCIYGQDWEAFDGGTLVGRFVKTRVLQRRGTFAARFEAYSNNNLKCAKLAEIKLAVKTGSIHVNYGVLNELQIGQYLKSTRKAKFLPRFITSGCEYETRYMVWKRLGFNLEEYSLFFDQRFSDHQWINICIDTFLSLRALHEVGVVHQNVQPAHFCLNERGEFVVVSFTHARMFDVDKKAVESLPSTQMRAGLLKLDDPALIAARYVAFDDLRYAPRRHYTQLHWEHHHNDFLQPHVLHRCDDLEAWFYMFLDTLRYNCLPWTDARDAVEQSVLKEAFLRESDFVKMFGPVGACFEVICDEVLKATARPFDAPGYVEIERQLLRIKRGMGEATRPWETSIPSIYDYAECIIRPDQKHPRSQWGATYDKAIDWGYPRGEALDAALEHQNRQAPDLVLRIPDDKLYGLNRPRTRSLWNRCRNLPVKGIPVGKILRYPQRKATNLKNSVLG